jgi:HAD superfamily hydrolase (TIGR01490 family)
MGRIFSEDRSAVKQQVAFFDLDRTIIKEISGKAIVRTAWEKGLISKSGIITALYLYILLKAGLRDPGKVIEDMAGWVKGWSEHDLDNLCLRVFNDVLFPSVYRDAIAEINTHKSNGLKVIILSSALDSICRNISEQLGMDGYICSALEVEEGYLTGRPAGRFCYGDEKLNRLNGYCIANNTDLNSIWYYSDSISDLPVLSAVGNPVCINPDRALKKEAFKRGWKILLWQD